MCLTSDISYKWSRIDNNVSVRNGIPFKGQKSIIAEWRISVKAHHCLQVQHMWTSWQEEEEEEEIVSTAETMLQRFCEKKFRYSS